MNFWPFPILRNNSENEVLTRIFIKFAQSADFKVKSTSAHRITVSSEYGDIYFWNANKYYAWASEGKFDQPGLESFYWKDEMPSRYACRCMRKAIEKFYDGVLND